ncbi:MAG: M48 family metallopeptidase [Deferribacteres bacterium]|nr:M48 family metallopeptidase [Deferribacteres bacterium]
MIEFTGVYFDGKTSRAYAVSVVFDGRTLHIRGVEGDYPALDIPLEDCTITPPLGNTMRSIQLPGGAQCQTSDTAAVSALERLTGQNRGMGFVHRLENRWKTAVGALAGLVLCVWVFVTYGIPFLAEKIAYSVPPELAEQMSRQAIEMLDRRFLKPSELDPGKTEKLQEEFQHLHSEIDPDSDYRLEFRKSPYIGPNAFALPSGLIIMTDELVDLADSNRELLAILAHETAHVKKRHGLRSIIQNSGVFLLVSALAGDITSITSTAASLPTLLARSGYSRKFETEADTVAALYMIRKGWGTGPFQAILLRITRDMADYPGESLLSSHPLTNQRVQHLRDIEASMPSGEAAE